MNDKPIIPESNKKWITDDKFVYIDRLYGDIFGHNRLILKDGSTYQGKIEKKSIKNTDGTLNYVYTTGNKWFDRTGMPIDKPNNLLTREKTDE